MNTNKAKSQWQDVLINQTDTLKNIIQASLQQALDIEFNRHIGVDKYERGEARNGYRNGSYERSLSLRVGRITLKVCRDREGNFDQTVFERYQRSEKSLVSTIIEMYFSGVSTRKVTNAVEELCGFGVSKSHVSDLVKKIDEEIAVWRNRLLLEIFKYLIFDARYEKVRENGRIVSKAFVVAIGITATGEREIIGTWVVNSESFEAWDSCIQELKDRGLSGVEYVVTDKNKGLCHALQKHFQGVKIQRCQVHFMRNFKGKLASSLQQEATALLQDVFSASTRDEALRRVEKVKSFLVEKKKLDVADWLDENIEETLTVLQLPSEHRKKMKSTNMLERVNQELKRRSRVVRIFPNIESCLRLLTAVAMDISEEWIGTVYLKM
jgi:putative transposase